MQQNDRATAGFYTLNGRCAEKVWVLVLCIFHIQPIADNHRPNCGKK
jgi:hypothetical protein